MLDKQEWKYDIRPEILDGKNIADYVDEDILNKLDQLEREEDEMVNILDNQEHMEDEIDDEYNDALKEVKGKRSILRLEHKMNRHKRAFPRGKDTLEDVADDM